jgi:hypothetical protein
MVFHIPSPVRVWSTYRWCGGKLGRNEAGVQQESRPILFIFLQRHTAALEPRFARIGYGEQRSRDDDDGGLIVQGDLKIWPVHILQGWRPSGG